MSLTINNNNTTAVENEEEMKSQFNKIISVSTKYHVNSYEYKKQQAQQNSRLNYVNRLFFQTKLHITHNNKEKYKQ